MVKKMKAIDQVANDTILIQEWLYNQKFDNLK